MTVVSTHLHHRLDGSTVRQAQTRALAELVACGATPRPPSR